MQVKAMAPNLSVRCFRRNWRELWTWPVCWHFSPGAQNKHTGPRASPCFLHNKHLGLQKPRNRNRVCHVAISIINSVTLRSLPQNIGLLIGCLCGCESLCVSVYVWEKQADRQRQGHKQTGRPRQGHRETETEREKEERRARISYPLVVLKQ